MFCCQKQGQNNTPLIATIGDRKITVSEFKDRANFNPIPGNKTQAQYKNDVLSSIVAEALLGQMENFEQPEIVSLLANQKKREAVIEQLWDEVIFKDIDISDPTLWDFYIKSNKQRSVEFAVFKDSSSAKNFRVEWENKNPKAKQILQTDSISFDGNIAVLEKEVFNAPLGQISHPVKISHKYLVYKPLQEWQKKILSRQEFQQNKRSVKKQYLKFEKQKRFLSYVKKTFKKSSYRLDQEKFKELTKYLESFLVGKEKLDGTNLELFDLLKVKNEIDPKTTMVNFGNSKSWSTETFFKRLAISPYPLNYSSKDAFRYSMIRAAKRLLDDELLFQKGLEYKMDNSNYVTWQSSMWRDFYFSQAVGTYLKSPKKVKTVLDSLKDNISTDINWAGFDSLTINTTKMMVLKTHFPGQTIVPRHSNWDLRLEKK